MRKLLQFVLIAALLLGGDALTAAVMPCCAQPAVAGVSADMQMPPAANPVASCHDAAAVPSAVAGNMSMEAAPMLRCPRAAASLQVSDAWKSNEQVELLHAPLQVAAHLRDDMHEITQDADRISSVPGPDAAHQPIASNSLPLRI